jgi:hypothetical protein
MPELWNINFAKHLEAASKVPVSGPSPKKRCFFSGKSAETNNVHILISVK